MGLVSLFLFALPFTGLILALQSQWNSLILGIVIMLSTPSAFSLIFPIEKYMLKNLKRKQLSKIMPLFYFLIVTGSIILVWSLVNAQYRGDVWVFLFAWACCYVPYNYMLQAEEAKGKVNLLTNVVNNFAVVGYFVFGMLMNFTQLPLIVALLALLIPIVLLMYRLPERIRAET